MWRLLLLTWTLLFGLLAHAHSPNAASIRLHHLPEGDVIEVIAPTAGVEAAFAAHYGDALPLISKEGRERLIRYLKETILLSTPAGPVRLGAGVIKVDAHQAVVRLQAHAPPGAAWPLRVHASCFQDNPDQLNTFRLLEGAHAARVLLRASNGWEARIERAVDGTLRVVGSAAEPVHGHD
jgi:hypothetical protein